MKEYEQPAIEVIEVVVENGFANTLNDYGNGGW